MGSLWETMLVRWLDPGSGEPFADLAGTSPAAAPAIALRREPAAAARAEPAATGGNRGTATTRTTVSRAAG
jgi:hypothetical protein